jgi:transcriptional regulator with GAF, ATPase, and Fis domain
MQNDDVNRRSSSLIYSRVMSQGEAPIIGESPAMQKIFSLLKMVAPSDSTVLLLGETGTGKELIARTIHNGSPRHAKSMVKVNCAALPANLIESELFGHERGSFTGAVERRIGKFELASGGTLFLDEIGEMPLESQVKLLRALQEKEIERVGGRTTIKVDARIIAATNLDLEKEVAEGRFRSDLYYRLNIFPIQLPALRERIEDIPRLANHFISRFAKKSGRTIEMLSNSVLQELIRYDWPGNIRELENVARKIVAIGHADHALTDLRNTRMPHPVEETREVELERSGSSGIASLKVAARAASRKTERELILKALEQTHWNRKRAARNLQISYKSLLYKIKQIGAQVPIAEKNEEKA